MSSNESLMIKMAGVLEVVGGPSQRTIFTAAYLEWHGSNPPVNTLPMAVQIRYMNSFWRNLLISIPDTLHIRSWLFDNLDEVVYMKEFREHWSMDIIKRGVLT